MLLACKCARIVEGGAFGGKEEAIVREGNKERQTGEACYAHTPRFVDVMLVLNLALQRNPY
jgi:hypothetical protein